MSAIDFWTIIGFLVVCAAGIAFSVRVRAILWAMIRYPFQRVVITFEGKGYTIEKERSAKE